MAGSSEQERKEWAKRRMLHALLHEVACASQLVLQALREEIALGKKVELAPKRVLRFGSRAFGPLQVPILGSSLFLSQRGGTAAWRNDAHGYVAVVSLCLSGVAWHDAR